MNINFEKLPTRIFDWIETSSFEHLTHSQQKEILTYFSVEEYNEMHRTFLDLKSASLTNNSEENHQRKSALLDHFDKYHSVKQTRYPGTLMVWQAAAILLLMLSGGLFYRIFDLKKDSTFEQVATTDTVYVTREVAQAPEIIHDTVFRYKETKSAGQKDSYSSSKISLETKDLESIGEMEIQPHLELENLTNAPKGNSMKDDSLLRKFGFVSM